MQLKRNTLTISLFFCCSAYAVGQEVMDTTKCRSGPPADRVEHCTKIIEDFGWGKSAEIWRNRGKAFGELGRLKEAINDYEKAIQIDGSSYDLPLECGSLRLKAGDLSGAIADFTRAITLDRARIDGRIRRADALIKSKQADQALDDIFTGLRYDADSAELLTLASTAFSAKGKNASAADIYKKSLERYPRTLGLMAALAGEYIKRKQHDNAIKIFGEMIALDPAVPGSYYMRGRALYAKRQFDLAEQDFTKTTELSKLPMLTTNARSWRGDARLLQFKWLGAIDDYTHAIDHMPREGSYGLYAARAWAEYKTEQFDLAIADSSEAISLNNIYPQAYHTRGAARLAKGDAEAAVSDLNTAIQQLPAYPIALADRGTAHERLNKIEMAIADYKQALAASPRGNNKDDFEAKKRSEDRLAALTAREKGGLSDSNKEVPKPRNINHGSDDGKQAAAIFAALSSDLDDILKHPEVILRNPEQGIAERRVALVIANYDYKDAARWKTLPNPKADADSVALELKQLGFAEVRRGENLGRNALISAIKDFGDLAVDADWAVVFYAGHGERARDSTFLVPTDAQKQGDLVNIYEVAQEVKSARQLGLVLFDACRSYGQTALLDAEGLVNRGANESTKRALGNVLISYAAKHNEVAEDGPTGAHSPYAQALLKHMKRPRVELRTLLGDVRTDVMASTNGRQEPHIYVALDARPYYFNPSPTITAVTPATSAAKDPPTSASVSR